MPFVIQTGMWLAKDMNVAYRVHKIQSLTINVFRLRALFLHWRKAGLSVSGFFPRLCSRHYFCGLTWTWLRWAGHSSITKGVSVKMHQCILILVSFLRLTCTYASAGPAQTRSECWLQWERVHMTCPIQNPTDRFGGCPPYFTVCDVYARQLRPFN